MIRVSGRLAFPGRRVTSYDYSIISISVYFTMGSLGEDRIVERRFPVQSDGTYELVLHEQVESDDAARVAAVAPSGQTLGRERLADLRPARGSADQLRVLRIDRPRVDFQPSTIEFSAGRSARLSGRLLARSGSVAETAGQRISLQAAAKSEPDGNGFGLADNPEPNQIWAGTTDRHGYFGATIQNGPFTAASVIVGQGQSRQELPVAIDADGRLPSPLLVVLDDSTSTSITHDHCQCDLPPPSQPGSEELATQGASFSQDLGAGCQSMTTPNRTLEEFDFIRIVRTTDPSIRGINIPDGRGDRGSTVVDRDDISRAVFDIGTLSSVAGASVLAARDHLGVVDRVDGRSSELSDSQRNLLELNDAVDRVGTQAASAKDFSETLERQISVGPLSANGVGTSAAWRSATDDKLAVVALDTALAKIPPAALMEALNDPDGFTPDKVMTLERRAGAQALRAYLSNRVAVGPGRGRLDEDNPVDWDHTPELYQATSVAHGHILHFKQEWKADGYSLGELVRSLPLAPGQQKQIVTLDWDREDRATRQEATDASERLEAELSRDRDINEIASSSFREDLNGSSSATTGAVGGGLGLAIGPLVVGGGGGSSWASSDASFDASRGFSAQSINQLQDQTSQSVSAVRNQRSTVVETVEQSETVGAVTEVISNFNRCHALTIQYFEVLRHFAVQERLARASECLFVPLEMSLFDDTKTLRWREILQRACRDRRIRRGFVAIERLSSPATTPPNHRFADDPMEELSGRLRFRVTIARPKDPDEAARATLEQTEWGLLGLMIRVSPETIYEQYLRNDVKKDQIFREEIAPRVAREFLSSLEVVLIDRDGVEHPADFDLTVTSRYQEGQVMEVVLNDNAIGDRLPRGEIAGIEVRTAYKLPSFSQVVLEDARLTYRTERIRHRLVSRRRINDDVLAGDPAFVSTSDLSRLEERNQLAEDRERRRRLLRHLNDNIEYFHRAIWLGMDANRRYMLLDGFEAPNASGRSIASVVENRLIGIVGNCLVLPVAAGFQLDPILREILEDEEDPEEVLGRAYDVNPSPPRRHSVPTRGVFGEAMAGTCVSCEEIDEDRFWRWSDYPLPDSPPAIAPLSTDSRFAESGSLSSTPLPAPLIGFQQIPDAPAPTGMTAALEVLAKDAFKDLTGLTQNQKNALAGLTASMSSAESFAGEAMSLALARDSAMSLDRTLGSIEGAKSAGYLDDQQASSAARAALLRSFGASNSPTTKPATNSPEVATAIEQASSSPGGSATITRSDGEDSETVSFETSGSDLTIGAAPDVQWIERQFWVDMAMFDDEFSLAGTYSKFDRTTLDDARNIGSGICYIDPGTMQFKVFDAFGATTLPAEKRRFNAVQAGLDAGLIRLNPADATKFQIKIETRLGYPGRATSSTTPRAVHFPHSGKRPMPLVAMVHGQSRSWEPFGPATRQDLPNGKLAFTGSINNEPNHEGFKYLQDHLAKQPEPILSLSINTNLANKAGSFVEMRAQMVHSAIEALKAEIDGDANHFLRDAVDFDKVGLLGHSRGGEAVLRVNQLAAGTTEYEVSSICSLAPTDRLTGGAVGLPMNDPSQSYLVVWGGLDGDVAGERTSGSKDEWGTGMRIYDRATSHKALIFAPGCTHNRFNNPAWKDETEWKKLVGGALSLDLPAGVASEADHEELLREYLWAFYNLTLNGDASEQPKFRNEVATAPGVEVIQQWAFGSQALVIDDFESGSPQIGSRNLGSAMTLEPLVSADPPASLTVGHRELHCNHLTTVCLLDIAAAAGPSTLSYDTIDAAGTAADLSGFDYLTLRLGQLYEPTDQASIDSTILPEFQVRMTDELGTTVAIDSATVYASMANPVAKPKLKMLRNGAVNATKMVLHNFAVDPTQLSDLNAGLSVSVAFTRIVSIEFEFNTGAGTGEIWIDSIQMVKR